MIIGSAIPLCSLLAVALTAGAAAPEARGLDALRWRARVLVVVSDDPGETALVEQRRILRAMRSAARERDLVAHEVIGRSAEADAVRRRFALPASGFGAVLVGKDGGAKLRSDRPIDAATLSETIDAMPMRRDEMRRQDVPRPRP